MAVKRVRAAKLNRPDVEEELIRSSEEHCDLPAIAKALGKPKNGMTDDSKKVLRKQLDDGPGLV